ncbi:MAG TPA: MerR family transcriptional regulator [Bacteroidetes bacterium]|jgi:DNA-binding transcriptional MerR regulator|nr:MerR family transcriptional regulator [Bacteroidota bacterium]
MKKLYYSIGEVSQLLNEEQYTLRYWEKEFPIVKPHKNRGGNRVYSPTDYEILVLIHKLLREKDYNIKKISEVFSSFDSKADIIKEKDKILSSNMMLKPQPIRKAIPENKTSAAPYNKAMDIINEILDILDE